MDSSHKRSVRRRRSRRRRAMPTIWKAFAKNETPWNMITPAARRSKIPGNLSDRLLRAACGSRAGFGFGSRCHWRRRERQLAVIARRELGNRLRHVTRMLANQPPVGGHQDEHRKPAGGQVLLVTEILIGGDNGEKTAASAAGNNSPFCRVPQPSSKAETISWPTRKRRNGTGVP